MKMKSTGIVRRMDDLGRLIVPKEVGVKAGVQEGEPFEIMYDENGVYFKRYDPMQESEENEEKIEWQTEYAYILKFIRESEDGEGVVYMEQLRALWTAFCLHQNIDVDAYKYDAAMLDIWGGLNKTENSAYNRFEYKKFYNAMSKYLV